jgi:hypothetical protein
MRLFFLIAVVSLGMLKGFAANIKAVKLTGWGIDKKNPEKFIEEAKAVGFDELITESLDPVFLKRAVEAGRIHHIKIFSCLSPRAEFGAFWSKRYPERSVPWQIMTDEQEAARTFIAAGKNKYIIPYQFGGEPQMTNEVLDTKIICLSDREAMELLKPLIDEIVSVPEIDGVAFDGFGYQNYHRCHCEGCEKLLMEFRAKNPAMPKEEAETTFFRCVLVETINSLADYARSKNPEIKTSIHIWPVFAPDPLYGNRLSVDVCGQTAAWFFLWPETKIAEYSRIISKNANDFYPRPTGFGMIGYYDLPGKFPVKDADRVDMELRTMMAGGCRGIMVCDVEHVIRNKEVSAVFRKIFGSPANLIPPKQ